VPLGPGTRLGSYEILTLIGSGGMGEVYRAKDTKLGRDVALKFLPDTFATDADRLARFEREAHVLASLNHPHIAQIYGLDEANGTQFLVLELVDGESLDKRITRGAIPIDEALGIARQIAEALEAAHEKGVIHRDLKPANIALTRDGGVKVLDFGLAKAVEATSGSVEAMNSPTITSPAMMTGVGMIVGTAAYMAPEQARGRTVDRRADIWAFACVLYEMLAATRAFGGEEVTDIVASVVRDDPHWNRLPADTPAGLRQLLERCLVKDPRDRLRDIGDARIELACVGPAAPGDVSARSGRMPGARSAIAGVLIAFVAALATWMALRPPPATSQPRIRLSVELGADMSVAPLGANIQISPDGRTLAFVGQKTAGAPQLYVRRLDQLQATALPGTEDANNPFFSPDGRWIAFFASRKLKKIATTGGAVVTLCDAPAGRGGAWADDGTIVFLPNNGPDVSLVRVSAAGGKPEPLLSLAEGEVTQRWPQMLPSGKGVLYTASNVASGFTDANIVVQPLPAGARKIVMRRGSYGRYLPSGHLVYIQDGTLFAAPFDLGRLETSGPAVPALEGIAELASNASGGSAGAAQMAVSENGTLAYLAGASVTTGFPVSWLDRAGRVSTLRAAPSVWTNPAFSPDGRRLALEIMDATSNLWVYEWERDTLARVTFEASDSARPVWTPDGRRLAFAATRADSPGFNLFWARADGTGEVQRLTESKNLQFPVSWHPSGRFLAFTEIRPGTSEDLMILPIEGDEASGWKPGKPTVFLGTGAAELEPTFSPDGRWIAYASTEAGRPDVYVRPYPGPGGKWLISTDGGMNPMWSRARHELFYTLDQRIMVVPYGVDGDSFRPDKPREWSSIRFVSRQRQRSVDLHPDGDRLALATTSQTVRTKQDKVVLVFNFFDELKRLAPPRKN
jgi:serine/threonine-protein kinase